MSLREYLATALFFAALTLQLAIPATQLFAERPARFGWQMFSTVRRAPTFKLRLPSGDVVAAPEIPLGVRRIEIDVARIGVAYLCRSTRASAVLVDDEERAC